MSMKLEAQDTVQCATIQCSCLESLQDGSSGMFGRPMSCQAVHIHSGAYDENFQCLVLDPMLVPFKRQLIVGKGNLVLKA